ncbi:MAG: hypothetical protein IIX07_05200, partial [Lachnospiraceae bacterium]|nr:hypothetical protein [Lachnospiraceae bacterium]
MKRIMKKFFLFMLAAVLMLTSISLTAFADEDDEEIPKVYHKDDEQLKCHYCAARMPFPSRCPQCGSTYIKHGAMGTQKICAELEKLLSQAGITVPVLRMDTDNTQAKGALLKILDEFANTTPSVLVGTQMIAKGHHFPK